MAQAHPLSVDLAFSVRKQWGTGKEEDHLRKVELQWEGAEAQEDGDQCVVEVEVERSHSEWEADGADFLVQQERCCYCCDGGGGRYVYHQQHLSRKEESQLEQANSTNLPSRALEVRYDLEPPRHSEATLEQQPPGHSERALELELDLVHLQVQVQEEQQLASLKLL